jgi:hypothetical protein
LMPRSRKCMSTSVKDKMMKNSESERDWKFWMKQCKDNDQRCFEVWIIEGRHDIQHNDTHNNATLHSTPRRIAISTVKWQGVTLYNDTQN